jgi:hypothetical protein
MSKRILNVEIEVESEATEEIKLKMKNLLIKENPN